MFHCYPDYEVNHITDLTPSYLRERGIGNLLLDYDNTLVPYTSVEAERSVYEWLQNMKNENFFLIIFSNSHADRVPNFCKKNNIPYVCRAHKPFSYSKVSAILYEFGLVKNETALVGDQIFTDVWAGNSAGLISILVKPIHLHNVLLRIRHYLEYPLIWIGRSNRKKK